MRVFLFNVHENLIASITLLFLVIFFIIILPYLILDAIFSKPLTEEEKELNKTRYNVRTSCGYSAGYLYEQERLKDPEYYHIIEGAKH